MSRGLGAVEQHIVARLREHERLVFEDLCPWVSPHGDYDASKVRTFRRALTSLKRKGLVDNDRCFIDKPGKPHIWRYTGPQ